MLLAISIGLISLGLLGLLVWFLFFKPVVLRVQASLPHSFPSAGFDHTPLEELLERFVTPEGAVRYGDWHADGDAMLRLDGYLAALALYSPENAPARFPGQADRLAYWLNAYNACVLKGVLAHWPIKSVHEVQGPLEAKQGLGFFWRLHFVLGGRVINLYQLENDVIRAGFREPRIHFVLNCGSAGCPVLRPELPTGPELEQRLQEATQAFISDAQQVRLDHDGETLVLSSIFKWYEEDFLSDLARRGLPASQRSLATWLALSARGAWQVELQKASAYRVEYAEYDWLLNGE